MNTRPSSRPMISPLWPKSDPIPRNRAPIRARSAAVFTLFLNMSFTSNGMNARRGRNVPTTLRPGLLTT